MEDPLFRPTALRAFLDAHGARAKKGLSQNFLIDGNVLRRIVQAAQIAPGDRVIEIGPGPGALTEQLLLAGAEVIAIELDSLFAETLNRLKGPLTVFAEDALTIDLKKILVPNTKLVANLPYHITTPLLARFVPLYPTLTSVTCLVQKEVAERFTTPPGERETGAFSLFLRFYSTPSYCFTVTKNCFYPAPKVDSAIIQCVLHAPPAHVDAELFFSYSRRAFQQRRKALRSSLREIRGIDQALAKARIDPLMRPEQLLWEQWLALYQALNTEK